jgi:hypothetical protein
MKDELNLPDHVPMLDASSQNFKEELEFATWSTGGSSDYRNDRDRPYNGQPHTDQGERGKTLVAGLTMRDIADCIVQGLLAASPNSEIQNKTVEISDDPDIGKGTKYASKNTWGYQDVYNIGDVDPLAAVQNAMCFVEHMMGIFPNVPGLKEK